MTSTQSMNFHLDRHSKTDSKPEIFLVKKRQLFQESLKLSIKKRFTIVKTVKEASAVCQSFLDRVVFFFLSLNLRLRYIFFKTKKNVNNYELKMVVLNTITSIYKITEFLTVQWGFHSMLRDFAKEIYKNVFN